MHNFYSYLKMIVFLMKVDRLGVLCAAIICILKLQGSHGFLSLICSL